ncbi:MAG: hypothetical protein ABSF23_17715 [Terracidiphilus sp.]
MSATIEGVLIRRMNGTDLARVKAIAKSLPDAPHWRKSAYKKAIDPDSTRRRIALVAVGPEAAGVRGFAVASLLPPQAELETIAVESASQRRGLSRKLLTS